jgi:hypothetical protein
MPNNMTPSPPPTATSEENAERGCVLGVLGDLRQLLSDAEAWHEGNVYIIRSTEFDVIAEDKDFDQALDKFGTWIIDYAGHLADLVSSHDATSDELETFATLSARILPLFKEMEHQESRQRKESQRRHAHRRRRANIWRHHATQASNSGRLSAV